jgi:hypothetical protein
LLHQTEVEKVRIGAGEVGICGPSDLGRDAVGQADGTISAVVVAGAQQSVASQRRCKSGNKECRFGIRLGRESAGPAALEGR